MSELSGKRALVTGASSGIGAAIARRLAGFDVDLVLTGRNREALDAVAEKCRERVVNCDVIVADLGAPGGASALWTAARKTGPIDILINNAGFGYFRPFQAADWARDAEMLQLNITTLVELSRRFVDEHEGSVDRAYLLNVASIGAYQAVPNMAVYASTKAFVRNFTEALHDELRGTKISATCVCPGGTRTNFHAAAGAGSYGWLARLSMMDADHVAEAAVEAMVEGQRNIVPGLLNKLATWALRLFTRRIAARSSSLVLGAPRHTALPERSAGSRAIAPGPR
jgi:short-subunit dehydrogenase